MRVVVTGAAGFVGHGLVGPLLEAGHQVVGTVRHHPRVFDGRVDLRTITGLDANQDWAPILSGQDAVVHLAARVHVMRDASSDPLAAFRAANVAGTLHLARQAASAGVRRFVFVSSIKVNGEATAPGTAFRATDTAAPQDAYGISKMEAEQALLALGQETGMEVVVVRPPLVYGPGVKGNFATMVAWVRRGVPLPLGAVTTNRRSLVALHNLTSLIVECLHNPAAAHRIFLVCDGEDLSTTELLCRLGTAMHRRARLIGIPPALLTAGARLVNKGDMAQRLLGNLQVDMAATCQTLGWRPPLTVTQGLAQAVQE